MIWAKNNSGWLLALLLVTSPIFADDEDVSLELFEFLAEWQDDEGRWIDPIALVANEEELIERDDNEEKHHD